MLTPISFAKEKVQTDLLLRLIDQSLIDKENLTFRVRFGTDITDEEPFSDYCSLNDTVKEFIKSVYTRHPYLFK